MRGRIRSVKPESLTDEDLWDLEEQTGFPIYRAFVGLWMQADREGRFEWRPRPLKAAILPYWEGEFSRVLDALTTRGFVVRYACQGREYGWVRNFKTHQSINNKEPPSVLPGLKDKGVTIISGCVRVNDASAARDERHLDVPVRKGTEGNGREEDGRVDDASAEQHQQPSIETLRAVRATLQAPADETALTDAIVAKLWQQHASQASPGTMHARTSWRADFMTIAAAINEHIKVKPERRQRMLRLLLLRTWFDPDGPHSRGVHVTPGLVAKRVTDDMDAASASAWCREKLAQLEAAERPTEASA